MEPTPAAVAVASHLFSRARSRVSRSSGTR